MHFHALFSSNSKSVIVAVPHHQDDRNLFILMQRNPQSKADLFVLHKL